MWRPPSLDHLRALSDDVGIAQHAIHDIPNRQEGYCTDDVARAFMVAIGACSHERHRDDALALVRVYLAFMCDAQMEDGRYHNFMSYARTWLDDVGTPDSNGRAIWAMGYGMRFAPRDAWRSICAARVDRALPHVAGLAFVRSRAYAALGLAHAYEASGRNHPAIATTLREIGHDLVERHRRVADAGWRWFENELTYDNARLPEALLRIGTVLMDRSFVDLGLSTLDFYESVTIEDGAFVPIGNAGWYVRGGRRARYAQQPLEAAALVDAALAAEAVTGEKRYRRLAECGLEWFYGRNSRSAVMATGGACCDGLEEVGVNRNMGAESTLAYLSSALALAQPGAELLRIAR
ncbi:MAG: glycosyl transferase [Vulcanimicrobiaceae bacterium]